MQKARSQQRRRLPHAPPPTACKHVVSGSLSLPAQGCFSPVPHGTRPLSVTQESLALEGGPPSFTPDFSSRALLRNSTGSALFAYRAVTVSGAPFQGTSADVAVCICGSYNPEVTRTSVWPLPRSLAATWGISVDFSFHQVLRCFSSLG